METTLVFWDFVFIAAIMSFFGGGSAYAARSAEAARLKGIEKTQLELRRTQLELLRTQLLNTIYSETVGVPGRQDAMAKFIKMERTRGARDIYLFGVILTGAVFVRMDLSNIYFIGSDLSEVDLTKANLSEASLNGADLSGANLRGANLYRADLSEASLKGAALCGANLSGAVLEGADLEEADLREADLRGVSLSGVANLTQDQKNSAILH